MYLDQPFNHFIRGSDESGLGSAILTKNNGSGELFDLVFVQYILVGGVVTAHGVDGRSLFLLKFVDGAVVGEEVFVDCTCLSFRKVEYDNGILFEDFRKVLLILEIDNQVLSIASILNFLNG